MNTKCKPGRKIPGYKGYYRVTRFGDVWSCKLWGSKTGERGPWRKLKPAPQTSGHLFVQLSMNGMARTRRVHQLVMLAFRGKTPAGMEIRHWDGNVENNCLTNLRFGTRKQNKDDERRHGTLVRGSRQGSSKLLEEDISVIVRIVCSGGVSRKEVAWNYGVSRQTIDNVVNRVRWNHIAV